MIGAEQLALMKPTAFLINVARGSIVNEAALIESLRSRTIKGAALDVFESEPIARDNPLLALENVILAPHSIAWTDEVFRGNGTEACESIVALLDHRRPAGIVNPEVLAHPRVQEWLGTAQGTAT
jgi:phosphoglycerate dehydrogenase-like enzyme